ncbi:PHD finger-like domain-containing protein 5A [Portunus trituberculatus]|uniref:PHD finger-like domain-containing protein 5A n=1 Tax=Portunus trituberculatus TaxID=210409 RepID=A0A5B7D604_PORTR|nr:PHD finger-like domain-containing protein 5A [Portunus trituberculatus]
MIQQQPHHLSLALLTRPASDTTPCIPSPPLWQLINYGVSDAYYCKECTVLEKDRDGCPKIVNLGSSKTDLFYERKKYGFKKR